MEDASRDMKGRWPIKSPCFLPNWIVTQREKETRRGKETEMPEQRISHLKPEDMNLPLTDNFNLVTL